MYTCSGALYAPGALQHHTQLLVAHMCALYRQLMVSLEWVDCKSLLVAAVRVSH
jgi:hypothetical protein